MSSDGPPEHRRPKGIVEEGLLEPSVPHGGAVAPHVLTNRPFLWMVLGSGVANVAPGHAVCGMSGLSMGAHASCRSGR